MKDALISALGGLCLGVLLTEAAQHGWPHVDADPPVQHRTCVDKHGIEFGLRRGQITKNGIVDPQTRGLGKVLCTPDGDVYAQSLELGTWWAWSPPNNWRQVAAPP